MKVTRIDEADRKLLAKIRTIESDPKAGVAYCFLCDKVFVLDAIADHMGIHWKEITAEEIEGHIREYEALP